MNIARRFYWLKTTISLFRNWPEIYLRKFLNRGGGAGQILNLRNGLKMRVRNKNTALPIIAEVVGERVYGDFPRSISSPVFIDIGANIGSFSLLALKEVPGLSMYSFEPEPVNFELLKQNVESNGFSNRARIFQKAVAGSAGKRNLYVSENSGTNSLFSPKAKSVEVEATTLERIFKDNAINQCDLLKIDCEGAEYEIIESAPQEILSRVSRMIIEWHEVPGHTVAGLQDFLVKSGFVVEESSTHRLLRAERMSRP